MSVITHYAALVIGACVGFAAAAILSAGKPPTEVRKVDCITCMECSKSRYEAHGGDAELVCWAHPENGGKAVRPSSWCQEAER